MKNLKWLLLIGCIAFVLIIGSLSGLANAGRIEGGYEGLKKPIFNPPNYLFGPVWTVLYILMGISLYLVIKSPVSDLRTTALIIFGIQLLLNFVWTFLFFYFRMPGVAFAEILTLWIFIIWMIFAFFRISHAAAYFNIPYFLWVSFATVLNGFIWLLNK